MINFDIEGQKIAVTTEPFMLRVNKKTGCFAVGDLVDGDMESHKANGRGKWLEGILLNADTTLYGVLGKGIPKEWTFVCLLVTKSDDARLRPGVVVHFPIYGLETEFFSKMATDKELSEMFGEETGISLIRIEFSKSIQTKFSSTIKPPVFLLKTELDKTELIYKQGAEKLLAEYNSLVCLDYALMPEFMPVYDETTGEFVRGFLRNLPGQPAVLEAVVAKEPVLAVSGGKKK